MSRRFIAPCIWMVGLSASCNDGSGKGDESRDPADVAAAEVSSDTPGVDSPPPNDLTPVDECADTDAAVAALKFYFVIHVEEDDAGCTAGSSSQIPDFNGNPGISA